MTHTLNDLKSGKLKGVQRLKLACGLKDFPEEILDLADTLEILDLSGNDLSELPDEISQLKKLKIIFFANNQFKEFPKKLASCQSLTMIGFKSNQIHTVPENAFPPFLQWLILTDNEITKLPDSLGDCHLLQKCALAGNKFEELPESMVNCSSLELLRVSANQLKEIPDWLFQLPKLSWVAFGGNPGATKLELTTDLPYYDWSEFEIKELLGEGASGLISKAKWNSKSDEIAIKVFKGAVTSDGLPEDEMGISIAAGVHDNLVKVLGKIKNHPEGKTGLIMKLIPGNFINLGQPPNFETCSRDVFNDGCVFSKEAVLKIVSSIASVCAQLHSNGINHGDLYAHNIMIDPSSDSLLGDFGAASFYNVKSNAAISIERVEVRAFGCLVEDLVGLISSEQSVGEKWNELIQDCFHNEVVKRPSFKELITRLKQF